MHAILLDEAVIPFLGVDPMHRDDFVAVMGSLVASRSFFVAEEGGAAVGFYRTLGFEQAGPPSFIVWQLRGHGSTGC